MIFVGILIYSYKDLKKRCILFNLIYMKLSLNTSYLKSISQYFGASLIPMALNVLINPLIASNMSPNDYAISGYYTSFNTLFSPLIVFYMLHYYTKKYYEVAENSRYQLRSLIFKSLIIFSSLLALISLLCLIIYLKAFNQNSEIPLYPFIIISVFALPLTGIYTLLLTDYKMGRKSQSFFKLSVSNGVTLVLFNILFIVILKWGALGKLLAPLATNLIFFTYTFYKCRNLWNYKIQKQEFIEMLKFCFPLTLAAMLGFFANGYDRVFLEKLGNLNELGYYVVGVQMANYLNVFQTAINSTFQPDVYENMVKRNYYKVLKVVLLMLLIITFVVVIFIILCPYIIDFLTAGRYVFSTKYTQIISLSVVTSVIYYSLSQITIALGKTKITFINKMLGSVLTIVMFSFLINKYHFIGACWGLVFSNLIFFLGNFCLLMVTYRHGFKNFINKK